jgi:hypothetical protein
LSSQRDVFQLDVTTWGWVHLVLGVVVTAAGVALFPGATWARALAVVLAGLSVITGFLRLRPPTDKTSPAAEASQTLDEETKVTATAAEVHGPIDFVLIEFPGDRLTGEVAPALADLVGRGIIRLYDLMVISKAEDGSVDGLELKDPSGVDGFEYFAGRPPGSSATKTSPRLRTPWCRGTVAALLVYENSWAIPFVAAARRSGGEMIASARIPAQDIMDALDALESVDGTID